MTWTVRGSEDITMISTTLLFDTQTKLMLPQNQSQSKKDESLDIATIYQDMMSSELSAYHLHELLTAELEVKARLFEQHCWSCIVYQGHSLFDVRGKNCLPYICSNLSILYGN